MMLGGTARKPPALAELRSSLDVLGEMVGDVHAEDLLNRIGK